MRYDPLAYSERCEKAIGELPEEMQAEWRQKLAQKLEGLEAELKTRLEEDDESPLEDDEPPF